MRRAITMWSSLALLLGPGASSGPLGAPEVVVRQRYPNGALQTEHRYRNGVLDGTSRGWYESGVLAYERSYRDGREHGTHRAWYENGTRRSVLHYEDGLSEGEQRRWYRNGRLYTLFDHHASHELGQQQMWNADGSIRSNYVIRHGTRYGLLGAMGCKGTNRTPDGAEP